LGEAEVSQTALDQKALLQKAIGPTGQIIGVDLTEAMLAQARERAG